MFCRCLASWYLAWRQHAITWANVGLISKAFSDIQLREISYKILMNLIRNMCYTLQHLTGANQLSPYKRNIQFLPIESNRSRQRAPNLIQLIDDIYRVINPHFI